jgi:hypothetical protein
MAGLLDWDRIYFDLLDYKIASELSNLTFTPATLRDITSRGQFAIYCDDQQLGSGSMNHIRVLADTTATMLRKYLAKSYDHERRGWEQKNLRFADLSAGDENLNFERYAVSTTAELAKSVRELVKEADELYRKDVYKLPTVHFDRHLYQPLLAYDQQGRFKVTPKELNKGETQFVRDLKSFLTSNPQEHKGKEVFLLRNRSRGHGIGFFSPKEGEAFFPDFILWIIEDGAQMIAFIDPHGLGRARGLGDPKIQLHQQLAQLQPELQKFCEAWRVKLTSFIVSPSAFAEVKRTSWVAAHSQEQFQAEHVFFQDGSAEYVRELWAQLVRPFRA